MIALVPRGSLPVVSMCCLVVAIHGRGKSLIVHAQQHKYLEPADDPASGATLASFAESVAFRHMRDKIGLVLRAALETDTRVDDCFAGAAYR